ncbi:MAG: uracil-DNA glycosylase [Sandaracinaceae bacterium]|nr:uracil-DNA glycosylase [Sandaracinaceae bacterium]
MKRALAVHRDEVASCRRCATVVGPAVIDPPIASAIYAIGQAPGPHEAKKGRPFAHTAGKALFGWFARLGVDEASYRERVYMAAVTRCFPGKGAGASKGDRVPSPDEVEACRPFVAREIELLRPSLVIPIGRLAIAEVLRRSALRARRRGGHLAARPLPRRRGRRDPAPPPERPLRVAEDRARQDAPRARLVAPRRAPHLEADLS